MDSVYPQQGSNGHKAAMVTLGDLFTRGSGGLQRETTEFFIVPRDQLKRLGIPACCVRRYSPALATSSRRLLTAAADGSL